MMQRQQRCGLDGEAGTQAPATHGGAADLALVNRACTSTRLLSWSD
jgi:hypothetical protein